MIRTRGVAGFGVVALGLVAYAASGALANQPESHRNGRIAFTRSYGGAEAKPSAEVWSMTPAGTKVRRLTAKGLDCGSPSFSPNGQQIVYTCGNLWVINADGSDPQQLTSTARLSATSPAWSPDGTEIAYGVVNGVVRTQGIWIVNSDGSDPRQLTHKGDFPSWSPDGSKIAFDAYQTIRVISAAGGRATSLTSGGDPAWSPDGSRIVFVRTSAGGPLGREADLWVMNADGTDVHRVTHSLNLAEQNPAWSPDGRWIVYSGTSVSAQGTAAYQLYLIHPDGTQRRQITHARPNAKNFQRNTDPSWRPRS